MNEPRPITAEDLALYALQALSAEERTAVEEALRDNPEVRKELARIMGDLALLGLSSEQLPAPAGALDRLKAQMRDNDARPEPMIATASERTSARRSRWTTITPWAIAAALAIACSILGYRVNSLNDALDGESRLVSNLAVKASRAQQVLEVLNAPDAQRVTLTVNKTAAAPTAHTIYLADRGALVMEASHLQTIPADKTYELWVLPANGSAPIPAGTFRPNSDGYASVVLPSIPTGVPAKGFGITIEKSTGSETPTMPVVLSGE